MKPPSSQKADILIVDDTVENLQLLSSILNDHGYSVRPVPSGKLALQAIENLLPDLILLDINMPDMNGYEVCQHLKSREKTREIPVIFISALTETLDKVKAFGVGGVDYVTKPFEFEEVMARVETHLTLRRAQTEIQRSHEQLQNLEQLRDSLVHMIVHDMRSPLLVQLGHLDLLKLELEDQPNQGALEQIDALMSATHKLNNMANDLLDISRLEQDRMPIDTAPCDITEVVEKAVRSIRNIDRDREILFEATTSIRTTCDEALVNRIVYNLVSNGLKHTPEDRPIRVSVSQVSEQTHIAVEDEGDGIPQEYTEKIFEKFGTLKARKGGKYHSVGLGLAFCKLAVEALGGQIGVTSAPEKGSTFWFTLPISTD